jgi:elongation factor Tu
MPWVLDAGRWNQRGNKAMDKSFRFLVEKVYSIAGKGVVVTGKVESGSISAGEEIRFLGTDGQWANAMVIGIEVSDDW